MIYMVSYDLSGASRNLQGLYEELQNSENWWHFLTDSWLIVTKEPAHTLAERLRSRMLDHDRLLVFAVGRDYSGYLPPQAWEWIGNALRTEEQSKSGPPVRMTGGPSVQLPKLPKPPQVDTSR